MYCLFQADSKNNRSMTDASELCDKRHKLSKKKVNEIDTESEKYFCSLCPGVIFFLSRSVVSDDDNSFILGQLGH